MNSFKEKLHEKIYSLNQTLWENRINRTKVDEWLNNFETDEEKEMALYLLSEFMYFGDIQIRILLKTLFRDYFKYPLVMEIRKKNNDTMDPSIIEPLFNEHLRNTRFMGIGNPSESGAHLLYFFRQENNLSKKQFINTYEIENEENNNVNHVIFIDDFCGSGSQANNESYIKYVNELKLKNRDIKIDYLMLIGTTYGIDNIRKKGIFSRVDAVIKLDNTFKCFDIKSRYFRNELPYDITRFKTLANKYGLPLARIICQKENNFNDEDEINFCASKNVFGFGDCQLLIGFNHNTPDNSLPIIWFNEKEHQWNPIFKRYNKIYKF